MDLRYQDQNLSLAAQRFQHLRSRYVVFGVEHWREINKAARRELTDDERLFVESQCDYYVMNLMAATAVVRNPSAKRKLKALHGHAVAINDFLQWYMQRSSGDSELSPRENRLDLLNWQQRQRDPDGPQISASDVDWNEQGFSDDEPPRDSLVAEEMVRVSQSSLEGDAIFKHLGGYLGPAMRVALKEGDEHIGLAQLKANIRLLMDATSPCRIDPAPGRFNNVYLDLLIGKLWLVMNIKPQLPPAPHSGYSQIKKQEIAWLYFQRPSSNVHGCLN